MWCKQAVSRHASQQYLLLMYGASCQSFWPLRKKKKTTYITPGGLSFCHSWHHQTPDLLWIWSKPAVDWGLLEPDTICQAYQCGLKSQLAEQNDSSCQLEHSHDSQPWPVAFYHMVLLKNSSGVGVDDQSHYNGLSCWASFPNLQSVSHSFAGIPAPWTVLTWRVKTTLLWYAPTQMPTREPTSYPFIASRNYVAIISRTTMWPNF